MCMKYKIKGALYFRKHKLIPEGWTCLIQIMYSVPIKSFQVLLDFSLTVKAALLECVIRTGQP